jgi:hypothetical protein
MLCSALRSYPTDEFVLVRVLECDSAAGSRYCQCVSGIDVIFIPNGNVKVDTYISVSLKPLL